MILHLEDSINQIQLFHKVKAYKHWIDLLIQIIIHCAIRIPLGIEHAMILTQRGDVLQRREVASQTADLISFGDYAVGGGFQIYLPELFKAIKIP